MQQSTTKEDNVWYVHSVVGHKLRNLIGGVTTSLEYTKPSMLVLQCKMYRIMFAFIIYIYCILAINPSNTHTIWVESKVGRELSLKYSINYTLPGSRWGWLNISLLSETAPILLVLYHKQFPVPVGTSYTTETFIFSGDVMQSHTVSNKYLGSSF